MPKKKLGAPTSTAVIYVGQPRYQLLAAHAREISYLSSTDIKASNFLHYLIDEFADKAHKKLLGELLEKTQSKED